MRITDMGNPVQKKKVTGKSAVQYFAPQPMAFTVAFALLAGSTQLWAGPAGEQVVRGAATVDRAGASTVITQTTDRAAINWQSFNIGATESVRFAQPSAASITLNRVLGQNPTEILGALSANGQIFLLNPNGVLFGQGAQVNVGGLVASTLSLSNEDFTAGRYRFVKEGNAGEVRNAGEIIANGGYVALIGPQVRNEGTITATNGSVALAAGDQVTLNVNGNRLIGLAVDQGALNALAENKGLIKADGGQVLLTAKAADQLIKSVVNNDGIIEAGTLSNVNGVIRLEADNVNLGSSSVLAANGARGGDIAVQAREGTLLADGRIEAVGSETTGGTVRLLGHQVGLINAASVDASGYTGGGTVLVGGDFQGKNLGVQNAFRTYVGPNAGIRADAISSGDGGKVIVWADDVTRFYGSISAKGGEQSGDGGFVETSGKSFLDVNGGTADTRASNGNLGTWLLDPTNIQVITAGANAIATQVDQFADADQGGAGNSRVSPATLNAAGANVILQAQNDITVTDAINLITTANANLTLQAGRSITVNNSVATNGTGNITMVANNTGNTETNATGTALTGSGGTNRGAGAATLTVNGALSTGAGGNIKLVNSASVVGGGVTGNLNITAAGAITTAARATSGATGTATLIAGGAIALGANVTTGNASSADAAGNQVATSGNIVISAGAGVTGAGRLITGNASISGAAAAGNDTATSGNIAVTAGTGGVSGGIGLSSVGNALTIGTAQRSVVTDTATAGNITLSSRDEINNGTASVAIGITKGAASGATTNNAGAIAVTTSTAAGNAFLIVAGPLRFGASTVAGNLSAASAGAITQAGTIAVTGTSGFNAGANAITLTTATNNFTGAVSLNNSGANNVAVRDANAIVLGASSVGSGTLGVTAVGITQTGAITQAAAAGAATFTGGAGMITLTQANDFTGAVSLSNSGANNVSVTDTNAIVLGASGVGAGTLTVNASGAITQTGSITQAAAAGPATFNAGTNAITLGAANNFTGAVSLNNSGANNVSVNDINAIILGTSGLGSGTLGVTAVGITQTGAITQAAAAGAATFAGGAGVITLTQANDFTGPVSATNTGANAIQTTDSNALQLGAINTANNLAVNAVGITQNAGGLTVGGTSAFNAGARAITLTTGANNFSGAVSLNNSGANNVAVTDVNAIVLAASNVGSGTLGVTAVGITQTGAITQAATAGAATFTGGAGVITLTQANDFTGPVSATNTGANAIQITDSNTLQLGAINTANNLRVNASGSVTQSGVVTANTLISTLTGVAPQLNLGTQNNNITNIGAITAPGGFALTNGNNPTTVTGAINTSGGNGSVSISTGTGGYTQNNVDITAGSGAITITVDAVAIAANTGANALQTTGVLTLKPSSAATAMSLAGAAAFDLTAAEITNLAGGVTGAGSIVIGDAAASTGAMTIGAAVNFGAKTVTLNAGSFTDGNTVGRTITAGPLNLNARSGAIGAAAANGAIDVAATNLTVNTVNQNAFVNSAGTVNFGAGASSVGTGNLTVTVSGAGNAITQSAGGAITANTLTLTTNNASATLNTATNAITNLGATALGAGALNLLDAGGLTVTGAVAASGGVTLNTSGALAANNTVNAGAGNVSLTTTGAGNAITQNATGVITAGTLALTTTNANATLNAATNAITNLGAATLGTGALNLLDAGGLAVSGAVAATSGITLNTSGALAINNAVNAGAGNVSLTSTGAVTQTQPITAAGLELLGAGSTYTLTHTGNNVATLAGNAGTITYTDSNALSIGTVNTTVGITAAGLVDVRTQTGDLTLTNAISTSNATANAVTLVADVASTPNIAGTGGNFINNAGAGAISTGVGGAWRIYTGNPAGATRGGLVETGKRYNVDDGSDPIATGNRIYFRNQPTLTLTADNQSKTYGAANPAFTYTPSGLIDGDLIGAAISSGPSFTVDGTVSGSGNLTALTPHNIIPSAATASSFGYTLSYANGSLTVNPLALTGAAIAGVNTTYGTPAATGAVSFGNVIAADVVNANAATVVSPLTSASGNLRAGSYAQNASGITGADSANYSFAGGFTSAANYNVAQLALTGAAIAAVNTTYGTPAATGAVNFGNVIGADVVNANTATIVSPLLSSSNNLRAGNYAQTVTGLAAGGDATNYSFGTFTTASNNYQVNQLALTGSVTAGNKVYDANTTASITGRNLAGAVAGDGVSYTGGTATFSDKNVGNGKTVTATGLSLAGADAGNYTVNTSATTTANVTPATLNVTYTGVNKVYDASATAAVNTADNHLGADVITINRTANFADANAGVGKTINVTGVTLSGADAGNYTVASTGTANADITPRGIIVTANNATKVYGGADPAFTFNVGGAGFAGADTITSVFTGALTRAAGENVTGSPYAINQGTLASNANYSITAYTSGQFSITPKALSITADNKFKLVSDPLPLFTSTYAGFAFADTPASLTGLLAFATPATAASPAGTYVITPSGQSSSNYTITFVSGALTVTGAPTVPGTPVTPSGASGIPLDVLASINSGADQLPPSLVSGPPALSSQLPGVQPLNVTSVGTGAGGSTSSASQGSTSVGESIGGTVEVRGNASENRSGAVNRMVNVVNGGVHLPTGVSQ